MRYSFHSNDLDVQRKSIENVTAEAFYAAFLGRSLHYNYFVAVKSKAVPLSFQTQE